MLVWRVLVESNKRNANVALSSADRKIIQGKEVVRLLGSAAAASFAYKVPGSALVHWFKVYICLWLAPWIWRVAMRIFDCIERSLIYVVKRVRHADPDVARIPLNTNTHTSSITLQILCGEMPLSMAKHAFMPMCGWMGCTRSDKIGSRLRPNVYG